MQIPKLPFKQFQRDETAILVIHAKKSIYRELSFFEKRHIRQPNVVYEPYSRYPDYENMVKNTAWLIKKHPGLVKIVVDYAENTGEIDERILDACKGSQISIDSSKNDALEETILRGILSEKNIRTIVACGFSSSDCLLKSVKSAVSLGVNVLTSLKLMSPDRPPENIYPEEVIFFDSLRKLSNFLKGK